MNILWQQLRSLWKSERGSVIGEYGIWIVLIIVVAAVTLGPLGSRLQAVFRGLCTTLGGTSCG